MEKEELSIVQKIQFWILTNLIKIELIVLFLLAICFLLDSFFKTNMIKVVSLGVLANSYLFTIKVDKNYSNTNILEQFISNLSKYAVLFVLIGFLFYTMQWPPIIPIVYIGQVIVIITFISFLILKKKNPESTIITNELILRNFVYSIISIYIFCFPLD